MLGIASAAGGLAYNAGEQPSSLYCPHRPLPRATWLTFWVAIDLQLRVTSSGGTLPLANILRMLPPPQHRYQPPLPALRVEQHTALLPPPPRPLAPTTASPGPPTHVDNPTSLPLPQARGPRRLWAPIQQKGSLWSIVSTRQTTFMPFWEWGGRVNPRRLGGPSWGEVGCVIQSEFRSRLESVSSRRGGEDHDEVVRGESEGREAHGSVVRHCGSRCAADAWQCSVEIRAIAEAHLRAHLACSFARAPSITPTPSSRPVGQSLTPPSHSKLPDYAPATPAFQRLSYAYETLSKPPSRRMYDLGGGRSFDPGAFMRPRAASSKGSRAPKLTPATRRAGSPANASATMGDETLNGVLRNVFTEVRSLVSWLSVGAQLELGELTRSRWLASSCRAISR